MRVNTNIASLQAQRNLSTVTRALARSMERLASGSRINSARDDASGLAVSNGLEAQVRAMRQATRNLNDAFGFLNTAEGAMAEQTQIVQRMRELAVQAANGTYSNADRANLDGELQQLLNEYNRLVSDTDFNGTKLLDGSLQRLLLQVGSEASHRIDVSLESTKATDAFTAESDETEEVSTSVGTGAFTQAATMSLPGGSNPYSPPVLADLNGDNHLDLVLSNFAGNTISVRLGNGDGSFSSAATLNLPIASYPQSSPVLADLNGDDNLDLVVANRNGNTISVRLGNGDGSFSSAATLNLPAGANPFSSPVLADLNGDDNLDLVVANQNGNTISVRLGNGDGSFSSAATLNLPAGSRPYSSPVLADLNGDNDLDLVLTNYSGDTISVRLGNGDGSFSSAATLNLPGGSGPLSSPVLADLNGDNDLDLVLTNYSGDTISVRLGNGDGSFSSAATLNLPAGANPYSSPVLADLNGDDNLDLVVANHNGNTISVRLGNGDGSFSSAATLNLPAGSRPYSSPVLADLNGDNDLDLVLTNYSGDTISVRLGNGNGTFSSAATLNLPASSGPYSSPILADLDGDDVLDIISANTTSNSISIFLATTTESSSSEAAADLTVDDLSIATQSEAEDSLDLIDSALDVLASARAKIGAIQNRLESAASVSGSAIESLSQARSQLVDSDVADETATFAKTQILQQGTLAVLTNANLSSRLVLDLLKF